MANADEHYENGDLFDNDNGEYYGRITEGAGDEIKAPPAHLTLYFNGYWYNFKMDSREAHQHSERNEQVEIVDEKASRKDKFSDL